MRTWLKKQTISFLILMVLVIIIVLPLVKIILLTSVTECKNVLTAVEVQKAIKASVVTTIMVVSITVPLSFICAFCITRTNIKFKLCFSIFCTLPIFLPPISFGFSLLLILGKNGLLYSLFGFRPPLMGKLGIIIGLILYTFPVSLLMFKNSLQKANMTVYESAILLGVPSHSYFLKITIPQLRKTIVTAIFSVTIMSLTEYGVCLIVGGKIRTLSLLIYQQVAGSLDFSKAISLGSILLFPLFFLVVFDIRCPQIEESIVYKTYTVPKNRKRDVISYILLTVMSLIFFIIIMSFVVMCFAENYPVHLTFSWSNIIEVVSFPYILNYVNSLLIALSVSSIGCFLSILSAYFASKSSTRFKRRIFYFISILPLVIPGLLIGIGYMLFYKGSIVYNTYFIIIMANIAHFFASPFLLSYHSFCNISSEYEDISKLYGISPMYMFKDVYLPCIRNTVLDMFFYLFSNSMITISAVVFLYTSKTMPYSLILNNFEGSIQYMSKSSAVSLIILLTNMFVFVVTSLLKRNKF